MRRRRTGPAPRIAVASKQAVPSSAAVSFLLMPWPPADRAAGAAAAPPAGSDIIGRAANVFDNVIVGVVNQPVRKQKTLFDADERVSFIEEQVAEYRNVQVKPFDTLLVDFAREHGAKAIVKGLRAISDFEYEFEMNQLNRKLAPEIESMYIFASAHYSFLSSTGVKEMATFGGDVTDLVPDPVAAALKERIQR